MVARLTKHVSDTVSRPRAPGLVAAAVLGLAVGPMADAQQAEVPADVKRCFAGDVGIEVFGGRLFDGVRLGVSRGGTISSGGARLSVARTGDDLLARSEDARVEQWDGALSGSADSEDFEGCEELEYTGSAYDTGADSNCRFSARAAVCADGCSVYDGAWKVVCDDEDPNVIASGRWDLR